jgi:ABC-type Fe3+-hydroxamate transport system substrate-binding protein
VAAALTPERKRILLIGLGLILMVLVAKQFLLKKDVPEAIVIPLTHHAVSTKKTPKHAKHVVKIDPSLPAALRTALRRHPVVVAVLYARHAPGDDAALKAARAGAHGAHAGFAVLDVSKEKVAQLVALKLPGTADPSVLVVRRPGKFKVLLAGYADSDAVAEAVHNAR